MKKIVLLALAVLMCFGVFACTSPAATDNGEDTSLAYIEERGKFILGLDDSFPPMGFTDENGDIVGFDIDLAQEVCDRMGVELVCQPIDWKAKELELSNKNIDVIWNGFTITDERKETLTMSEPYMKNEQIIVTIGTAITSLADLEGKKVAVQDGSSAQEAIADTEAIAGKIEQIDFKDNVTALLDLQNGQVDAVAMDSVVARYYISKNPGDYVILDETLAPEEYGIGFRQGDEALRDAVWAQILAMVEDGTYQEICEKWGLESIF